MHAGHMFHCKDNLLEKKFTGACREMAQKTIRKEARDTGSRSAKSGALVYG